MSEEEKNETKCFCQNKEFRKFLVIALGTFVGVYAALSLFAATHRPPMPPCAMGFRGPAPMVRPCPFHHHHFDKKFDGENVKFHKAIRDNKGPAPFEQNRNQEKN